MDEEVRFCDEDLMDPMENRMVPTKRDGFDFEDKRKLAEADSFLERQVERERWAEL